MEGLVRRGRVASVEKSDIKTARDVAQQDISKLFLSNTVGQMQNSLDTNKVRLQQLQHELKNAKEEVFTIKKKFNEQVFEQRLL